MNYLFPFADFLWILQKEEYDSARYIKWLRRFFFRRGFVVSEQLVYTARAKITLAASILLWALILLLVLVLVPGLFSKLLLTVVLLLLIPIASLLANVALSPVFSALHGRQQARAAERVQRHAPLNIVGIAGSFGKTTTKHFLYDLVRYHYRTQMIPGTINTPSGIAAWILKELAPNTQLLIVEMDAYKRGEIAASARMTPPDIAIVTNVGDQHLERFGSKKALAASLGEILQHSPHGSTLIVDTVTLADLQPVDPSVRVVEVRTGPLVYQGTAIGTENLSQSNKENLARALVVADLLHVPAPFVIDTSRHLELPDRRQKMGSVYGYEGIDDSYNISLTTAKAGLAAARALADTKGKKLFVVAAGIPEAGPDAPESNRELGQAISAYADQAIVLDTMFSEEIRTGIGATVPVMRTPRLETFLKTAHEVLPPGEWVGLFQPALPDLYY